MDPLKEIERLASGKTASHGMFTLDYAMTHFLDGVGEFLVPELRGEFADSKFLVDGGHNAAGWWKAITFTKKRSDNSYDSLVVQVSHELQLSATVTVANKPFILGSFNSIPSPKWAYTDQYMLAKKIYAESSNLLAQ